MTNLLTWGDLRCLVAPPLLSHSQCNLLALTQCLCGSAPARMSRSHERWDTPTSRTVFLCLCETKHKVNHFCLENDKDCKMALAKFFDTFTFSSKFASSSGINFLDSQFYCIPQVNATACFHCQFYCLQQVNAYYLGKKKRFAFMPFRLFRFETVH